MPDDTKWRRLGAYECEKFLESVRDPNFAALFTSEAYELWARNLRFFDGYEHYMLCNKTMIPFFTLHYISNGENHFFLDGSEHSLELLIRHGSFRLTEDNIMTYLEFHSDVTFYPYRKVKFITDPSRTPYSGASAMGHHFKSLKYGDSFELIESKAGECFYVTMPVLYNGETVKGHVQVMKTGQINILKPVNIPLMDGGREHNAIDYDHPHEKELLEQNLEILVQSKEGKRLWETIKSYGGSLKFVSGVGSNGFCANGQEGFIVAPENLSTQSAYQVIAMAGILREMELFLMDEKRPDPFGDSNEVLERNLTMNLDILYRICIIGEELEEAGIEEVQREFKKSGFESFYGAYKNKRPDDELIRTLAQYYDMAIKEE